MDVRLSPEQDALRAAAARAVDRLGPRSVAEIDDPERVRKLDAAVGAAGWRDLRVPEEGMAPLASGVEAAIVAEELGRGLAGAPFLGPTLAAELRRLAGAPASGVLETVLLSGSRVDVAVASDGRAPPGALAVDAAGSSSALLLVPAGGGHVLGRVDLQPEERGADLTRPVARAAPTPVFGPDPGSGRPLASEDRARWIALGLALTSADLVGIMRAAIDLAVGYASVRRQFERPIGSFQAVQHMLADAHVVMEGSRSVARHAAWAVDALSGDAALGAAAVAKAYCARAARTVCETSIQVHGGIGNTWQCLAHVHLRRALLSGETLGGAGANVQRVLACHGIGDGDGLR